MKLTINLALRKGFCNKIMKIFLLGSKHYTPQALLKI